MKPSELSSAVRGEFAYLARYLSELSESSPNAGKLLRRPDVQALTEATLAQVRETAIDAVREAWAENGGPQHEYLDALLADVERAVLVLGRLRAAVTHAHADGADAVRSAVLNVGASVGLQASLAAEVAATAAQTFRAYAEGELREQAGETVYKTWASRRDAKVCHWCRQLNGVTVPLHSDFPAGDPEDLAGHGRLTQPPRLYHGHLAGPPRHPRCRCRLVISGSAGPEQVTSESGGQEPVSAPHRPGFLAASAIRELPDDKYEALVHFLRAATHELAQALARLRSVLST